MTPSTRPCFALWLAALLASLAPHAQGACTAGGSYDLCGDAATSKYGSACSCQPGLCCSRFGYCGPGRGLAYPEAEYCGNGCQSAYGTCKTSGTSSPPGSPPPPPTGPPPLPLVAGSGSATPTTPASSSPPATASGSPNAGSASSGSGGLSSGAIGGIVGGVLGGAALLALLAVLLLRRRRRRQRQYAGGGSDGLTGMEGGRPAERLAAKQAGGQPHDSAAEMELAEGGLGVAWKGGGDHSSHATNSDAISAPSAPLLDAPPEPLLPQASSRAPGTPPASHSHAQPLSDRTTVIVTHGPGGSLSIAKAPASPFAASGSSQGTGNSQAVSIGPHGPAVTPRSGSSSTVSLPELPWSDWQLRVDEIILARGGAGEPVKLGSGAYGTVYQATIDGTTEVAVKIFHESHSQAQQADILREVAILKACRDRNIVQFLGACITDGKVMLVTELMAAGDLWHALSQHKESGALRWYRRGRRIAVDIARGLAFLHRRRIVHFDLKSPNVLLTREGQAKISDVGFARILSNTHLSDQKTAFTFAWAAPEVLTGRPCTDKADIFSFGVVLWEIVTGEQPRRGQLRACRTPEECPARVEALIQRCLEPEPGARPSCKEVVEALTSVQDLPAPGEQA